MEGERSNYFLNGTYHFSSVSYCFAGDYQGYTGRNNSNDVDLNRDFPARFPERTDPHRQPEVLAVMRWFRQFPFILSANLHGGSLVANYPFDDSVSGRDGVATPSPDDKVFKKLARVYSKVSVKLFCVF